MARSRDLFSNFDRMRREMDELFGDIWDRASLTSGREEGYCPAVDVYYVDDPPRAVVRADLPGVSLEDIALEIADRELTISGERPVQAAEGRVYEQVEVETGRFRRTVTLGAEVASEQARATYADGVLRVELPLRGAAPRARQVPIDAGRP